jgi:hypothetical protein
MQTILVQIAAYRDSELIKTIQSALAAAALPDRLRFAVVNQAGEETEHLLDEYANDPRFTIETTSWRDARGVGAARRRTDEMFNGEDFFLQIDSHMRFLQDWDERLITQWQACDDSSAIISSYPPAYRYDENDTEIFIKSNPNRLVVHEFYLGYIPIFFGKELPGKPDKPVAAAFVAGGLQFGPGRVCTEVVYQSDICFIGEEIVHSLRLFTHGYNIYAPTDQVISHLYIRSKNQKDVHHFWNDFTQDTELKPIYEQMNKLSYQTVADYLSGKRTDGIGTVRTLREFENFTGVDFDKKTVHKNTYSVPQLPVALDDVWRNDAIASIKQS